MPRADPGRQRSSPRRAEVAPRTGSEPGLGIEWIGLRVAGIVRYGRYMRPLLAIAFVVLFGVAAAYASRPEPASPPAPPAPSAVPDATADPRNDAPSSAAAPAGRWAIDETVFVRPRQVTGLALPLDGAELPTDAELRPGAPRAYRAGWHEGIDFPAPAGTPVRAVAAGTIVRVDRDFTDWDDATRAAALAEANALGYTPERTLDTIRGRQVWIDRGRGIVTRYAHLSAVADLVVGQAVEAGQVVGAVGSSGLPEGGPHLHLEVRVGASYLGEGLDGERLVSAIARAFD